MHSTPKQLNLRTEVAIRPNARRYAKHAQQKLNKCFSEQVYLQRDQPAVECHTITRSTPFPNHCILMQHTKKITMATSWFLGNITTQLDDMLPLPCLSGGLLHITVSTSHRLILSDVPAVFSTTLQLVWRIVRAGGGYTRYKTLSIPSLNQA